ncbi:MAG TPA: ABC transporter permease [Bryobacteraceae bacterium]|nr:ABC transporter permease [Bryobacteraceae bacterium]
MPGNDLVYATRSLSKSPVFFVTAVVTIALGIGASTAIFSVTNAVLLRPLPYKDPSHLVLIGGDMRKREAYDQPLSYENFSDLRNGTSPSFEDMAAIITFRNNIPRQDGTPEQVSGALVTPNFFRLLGAKIAAGRDFDDADGQPPPPPPPGADAAQQPPQLPVMAVITNEYWQRRFGGSREIFGHRMPGAGPNAPVIVGVLAPRFELEFRADSGVERHPDIFAAARMRYDNRNRNTFGWHAIGRVKSGVSLDRVAEQASLVATAIRRDFPIYGGGGFYFHIEPMRQHLTDEVRPAILALTGAVTFLLLIACANVANLLLVRTSLRERDLAIRAALGGNRWRLIRQMLAESFLISAAGTVLGLGLAYGGIRELMTLGPRDLPRLEKISIDPTVLAFSIGAGVLAAILFGLAPTLRASRPDLMQVLRGAGRSAGLGGSGFRNSVTILEVALSFVLLIGSGLMVRSFIALQHIDLGFDPDHLLTFLLLGGRGGPQPQARAARIREIQARLSEIHGVESVTAAMLAPLSGGYSTIRWGLEDALTDPSKYRGTDWQTVLPGFFETMRTPLIAGRTFTDADNAPDRKYVIVDQMLAEKAFPHQSAVGKRILIRVQTPEPEWVEIIGVVAHQRAASLVDPGHEQIYFTDGFRNHGAVGRWMLRVHGDPASIGPAVRAAIAKLDPNLLIAEMQPESVWVDRAQASTRFALWLIGAFAVIAAVLAAVGLYGVLATFVRQRTAEIGVRMALGAAPASIFALVVGQGMALSAMGIGIGLMAAGGLTRAMATLLVGVRPTDPVTFVAVVVFFLAIAGLACWIPAWRAAALDPTVALREE